MISFGNLYGFLFIWTFIIVMIPASFALSALTFADYVLQPFYLTCEPPLSARLLLGAAAISMMNVFTLAFFSISLRNSFV